MKRFLLLLIMGLISFPLAAAENVWVGVQKSLLRSKPSFIGKSVAQVNYQQKLQRLETANGWSRVALREKQGWIHSSALTEALVVEADTKKTSFSDGFNLGGETVGNVTTETSAEEITLAGKGFNKDVEKAYGAEQKQLNYKAVDLMEKRSVAGFSPDTFASAGELDYLEPEQWNFAVEKSSGFSNPLEFFQ